MLAAGASSMLVGQQAAVGVPPETSPRESRPLVYRIEQGDPTMMQPFEGRGVTQLVNKMAKADVVLIGYGRGDADDAAMAAEVASEVAASAGRARRRVVLGLDAAPADAPDISREYAGEWPAVADAALLDPLFDVPCAERVGLGVSGDALRKVQRAGVAALDDMERQRYVDDPLRFANFAENTPGFDLFAKRFVARRFASRYGDDAEASAAGYFATSLLQDEAVATGTANLIRTHPNNLVVAVCDSDRVQFSLGARARLEQMLLADQPKKTPAIVSILVNPSAASTFSATTRLRLSLTDDISLGYVPPVLADVVWFSSSPPPNLLSHMLNPIDGNIKLDFGFSTGGKAGNPVLSNAFLGL